MPKHRRPQKLFYGGGGEDRNIHIVVFRLPTKLFSLTSPPLPLRAPMYGREAKSLNIKR